MLLHTKVTADGTRKRFISLVFNLSAKRVCWFVSCSLAHQNGEKETGELGTWSGFGVWGKILQDVSTQWFTRHMCVRFIEHCAIYTHLRLMVNVTHHINWSIFCPFPLDAHSLSIVRPDDKESRERERKVCQNPINKNTPLEMHVVVDGEWITTWFSIDHDIWWSSPRE